MTASRPSSLRRTVLATATATATAAAVALLAPAGAGAASAVPTAVPAATVTAQATGAGAPLMLGLTLAAESEVPFQEEPLVVADDDGDGCDTWETVLAREAVSAFPLVVGDDCEVLEGVWTTGAYSTTDPREMEVRPLVSVREAWQSGAHAWSPQQRQAYLNDLVLEPALTVATRDTTDDWSGSDPAEWPLDFEVDTDWCAEAADWLEVKARWNLSIDEEERYVLAEIEAGCGAALSTGVPTAGTPQPGRPQGIQRTQTLPTSAALVSPDGRYRFVVQGDGNAVVYGPAGATWASRTAGQGHRLVLGGDGNLVMYDALGRVAWFTGTRDAGGTYLLLQDDGNLVLYRDDASPVWSSHTGRVPVPWVYEGPDEPAPVPPPGPGQVDPREIPPSGLASAGDRFRLLQGAQGWEIRDANRVVVWTTASPFRPRQEPFTTRLVFQDDGNLVEYDRSGRVLVSTQSRDSGAVRLVMQDDGNLVLYRADGRHVWSTQTGNAWGYVDDLRTGEELWAGDQLVSRGYGYDVNMQEDGNVVVYGNRGRVVWHSGTYLSDGQLLVLQRDGNLVLRDGYGTPVWWTGTEGSGATSLIMQTDGNLVLYRPDGRAVWSTLTGKL